jgi:hypothetical protein
MIPAPGTASAALKILDSIDFAFRTRKIASLRVGLVIMMGEMRNGVRSENYTTS